MERYKTTTPRKTKSGTWMVKIYDRKTKKYTNSRRASLRRVAVEKADELVTELNATHGGGQFGTITIDRMTTEWLTTRKVTASSTETYTHYADKLVHELGDKTAVTDITTGDLLPLITSESARQIIQMIFRYGTKAGYLTNNPAQGIPRQRATAPNTRDRGNVRRALSDPTILTDLSWAFQKAGHNRNRLDTLRARRNHTAFALYLMTCLRNSELRGLTWDRVSRTHITIDRQLSRETKDQPDYIPPKTLSSRRDIPMTAATIILLKVGREHLEEAFETVPDTAPVFPALSSLADWKRPWGHNAFGRAMNTAADSTGRGLHLRTHDLRGLGNSLMAEHRIEPMVRAELLGHLPAGDLVETVYLSVTEDQKRTAMLLLSVRVLEILGYTKGGSLHWLYEGQDNMALSNMWTLLHRQSPPNVGGLFGQA